MLKETYLHKMQSLTKQLFVPNYITRVLLASATKNHPSKPEMFVVYCAVTVHPRSLVL